MKYRAEIDGLRALAVLPVILFHAGFKVFSGGFIGVDIFFVVSGYLITTIIISEMAQGEFSPLNFYERRARRILPALFFVVIVCLPFAWMLLSPRDMKDFSQSLAAAATFSSNVLFWRESGYFDTAAELKPLLHTWSLAVEEQYYILFPLFLAVLWRFGLRVIFASLSVVFIVSFFLSVWGAGTYPSATFFLLPARGWELLVGAFVALYLYKKESSKNRMINQTFSLFGVFLVVFAIFVFDDHTPFPSYYAVVPTVGAAFIILFANQYTIVNRVLQNKIIVGIGLISYSAYLWHQPLFALVRYRSHPGPYVMGLLCLVSLVLAYVSWRLVEQAFRKKDIFSSNKVFLYSGVGLVAFMSLGVFGHLTNGFVDRFDEATATAFKSATSSPKRDECHTGGDEYRHPVDACSYFNESPSWVAVGDSHAVELAYGLAIALKDRGDGVRHMSFSGCVPSYGIVSDDPCTIWTKQAVQEIVQSEQLKNVVVSYRIAAALFGGHKGAYPDLPNERDSLYRDRVWRAYLDMLGSFLAAEKNVYLVVQAPEVRVDINRIIAFRDVDNTLSVEGVSRDWWSSRMKYVKDRMIEIPSGVEVIDPSDYFCDAASCYVIKDGKSLYFDDNHLSVYGATLLAGEIVGTGKGASDSYAKAKPD